MELVDLVIVNKADGELIPRAKKAASDYRTALHLISPKTGSFISK
jgi:LAO/AO transport system kinase